MQNNYDDFLDRVYARDGKLRPGPAQPPQPVPLPQPMMTPAHLRAQRRQYGKAINRRPPKYEPVPHEVMVIWTALLFFAGVIVLAFIVSLFVR